LTEELFADEVSEPWRLEGVVIGAVLFDFGPGIFNLLKGF
jgi:hypothetical protein